MTIDTADTNPSSTPMAAGAVPASEDLRRTLQEWQEERERVLAEIAPVAAPHLDPVAFARAEGARETIAQIRGALERVANGTYGVCRGCGERIPAERLEIRPYTESCVLCSATPNGM